MIDKVLDPSLNIYSVKNFIRLSPEEQKKLRILALTNYAKLAKKMRFDAGSFGALVYAEGPGSIFDDIYKQYQNVVKKELLRDLETKGLERKVLPCEEDMPRSYYTVGTSSVYVYIAKNTRFVSKFHDHRNAAVSSVYYPQIQKGDSISFFANNQIYDYYPEEFELLIHPSDLRHRPNCPVSENRLRISLNMLISKEQTQGRVFGK
jgi:hypothetical protein|tara:strand:- start:335 stop:952 length:618 start_codon:yes stop_codon:yes gene_type:complete